MQFRMTSLAIPAIACLAGAAALAQPVQVLTSPPAPAPAQYAQSTVVIAPDAPPPARVETVPAPPAAQAQVMYLAARPLDVERRQLGVGVRPVRAAAGAAGGLGAGPLGTAALRRLCLGGRTLAGLKQDRH